MENLKPIFDFANEIKSKLEREYPSAQISVEKVTKNNNMTAIGLCIKEEMENISQMIYVNELYKDYVSNKASMDDIVLRITRVHEEANSEKFNMRFDVKQLLDKDYLRKNVCLKLVNQEYNTEYLKDAISFPKFTDLAAMLYVIVQDERDGIASCKFKQEMLQIVGLSRDELYDLALRNTMEKFQAQFADMMEFFHTEGGDADEAPEGCGMWVLKNSGQVNGAVAILYPNVLKWLCEKYHLKTNLVLLPSSIHEWIIVEDDGTPYKHLRDMVRTVNATELKEDDVLSNSIYLYAQEDGSIEKIKFAE